MAFLPCLSHEEIQEEDQEQMSGRALLTIVCCCCRDLHSHSRIVGSSPLEILPLVDGSFVRFERFSGALLRPKGGRQIARVRLPPATMMEHRTDVVMSKDESRLLVVHGDSMRHYPPRHRVVILDLMSLRTIAQPPLGDRNVGLTSAARARDDAVPAVASPRRQS